MIRIGSTDTRSGSRRVRGQGDDRPAGPHLCGRARALEDRDRPSLALRTEGPSRCCTRTPGRPYIFFLRWKCLLQAEHPHLNGKTGSMSRPYSSPTVDKRTGCSRPKRRLRHDRQAGSQPCRKRLACRSSRSPHQPRRGPPVRHGQTRSSRPGQQRRSRRWSCPLSPCAPRPSGGSCRPATYSARSPEALKLTEFPPKLAKR